MNKLSNQPSCVDNERSALAPTGALRVGVYRGSPSSYVSGTDGERDRGVGYLLGHAFSEQLGVPFEPVVFAKNVEVLAAVEQGQVDLVFTNATSSRARVIDFSMVLLDVEKSVLLPAGSPYSSLESLNGQAVRLGITAGSSTGAELESIYSAAHLIPVSTLQQAAQMLASGELDGFATNKTILFELASQVQGSQVLPGAWGLEHLALGIPLNRRAGHDFLARFARNAQSSGLLQSAVDFSRLQGTVAPTS